MRKFILTLLISLAASLLAQAQVEYLYIEAMGSAQLHGKEPSLVGDHLILHAKGNIAPSLKYRLRQRFSIPIYDPKNPLNATDFLQISWDISPKWSLDAGKMPVNIGGYEWDDAPTEIYYWGDFINSIAQIYALAGTAWYRPAPGQNIYLQFSHSLQHLGHPDVFNVGLGWYGQIAPWWNTIWGFSCMDDPYRHRMGYLALGNRFQLGSLALELDLMYRRSLIQKSAGFDGSVVARLEYNIGQKWSLFAKGGWDYNDASNVDPQGIAYDLTVVPGNRYLFGGGGMEYYPLGNPNLRIHAVGWFDDRSRLFHATVGMTFRLNFIK